MKLGQLIDYEKRNVFLQRSYRKLGSETSSRPLFIFKICMCEVKSSVCSLVSMYFDSPQLRIQ